MCNKHQPCLARWWQRPLSAHLGRVVDCWQGQPCSEAAAEGLAAGRAPQHPDHRAGPQTDPHCCPGPSEMTDRWQKINVMCWKHIFTEEEYSLLWSPAGPDYGLLLTYYHSIIFIKQHECNIWGSPFILPPICHYLTPLPMQAQLELCQDDCACLGLNQPMLSHHDSPDTSYWHEEFLRHLTTETFPNSSPSHHLPSHLKLIHSRGYKQWKPEKQQLKILASSSALYRNTREGDGAESTSGPQKKSTRKVVWRKHSTFLKFFDSSQQLHFCAWLTRNITSVSVIGSYISVKGGCWLLAVYPVKMQCT